MYFFQFSYFFYQIFNKKFISYFQKVIDFCKHLIETFLIVIIRLYTLKCTKDETTNGLNAICVRNEQNQVRLIDIFCRISKFLNLLANFKVPINQCIFLFVVCHKNRQRLEYVSWIWSLWSSN